MTKSVDDAANAEMAFRLTRILGGLNILTAVADTLVDANLRRHIKEVREKVYSLSKYCKQKYGVILPKPATTDEQ